MVSISQAVSHSQCLHPSIQELKSTIEGDQELLSLFCQMFDQIPNEVLYLCDPVGGTQARDYLTMLGVFNALLENGPTWKHDTPEEQIWIGCPFNTVLAWPMNTPAGAIAFLMPKVNKPIRDMLNARAEYLASPTSISILEKDWLSLQGIDAILLNVNEAKSPKPPQSFAEAFKCDPSKPAFGFSSWDDFFTRRFQPGVRPVAAPEDNSIIVSPCEATPERLVSGLKLNDTFWLKSQPYSLRDMFDNSLLASYFINGTCYQAYLSALSYHRWHSAVSGTIVQVRHIPGAYFATNPQTGFTDAEPDAIPAMQSQPYLACVATRAAIFILADNPKIGLVAFLAVGMGDVSSCDVTVQAGQHVCKGEEIGTFHYGGSTFCLLFGSTVELDFVRKPPYEAEYNLPVCSHLAQVL